MREEPRSRAAADRSSDVVAVVVLIVLVVAAAVARHNLRKGRGDGAARSESRRSIFVATLGDWLIRRETRHRRRTSSSIALFTAIGWSLFCAGALVGALSRARTLRPEVLADAR